MADLTAGISSSTTTCYPLGQLRPSRKRRHPSSCSYSARPKGRTKKAPEFVYARQWPPVEPPPNPALRQIPATHRAVSNHNRHQQHPRFTTPAQPQMGHLMSPCSSHKRLGWRLKQVVALCPAPICGVERSDGREGGEVTAPAPPEVAAKVQHRRGVGIEVDATGIEPVRRIQRRHTLAPPGNKRHTHRSACIKGGLLPLWQPRRSVNAFGLLR
jgi:hypothetical protein